MQPMGFWESILFGLMALSLYGILGWCATMHPDFEDESNLVKRLAIVIAWPLILLQAIARGVKWTTLRLIADARKLRPTVPVQETPKCVTGEMLATQPNSQYRPGQWANDV